MDEEVAKEMQAEEDHLAGCPLQASTVCSTGFTFEGNDSINMLTVN